MTNFRLVEKSKSIRPIQYDLISDESIILQSCTYTEGFGYTVQQIQQGDTYEEIWIDKNGENKSITKTYEEILEMVKDDAHFARGE